ncbi:MAG: DNA gyrase inhibitor YacG [Chlamydiia bacterium]|nr:DNA gyrase inhibitor YacG [Chlamydiia bacterium]
MKSDSCPNCGKEAPQGLKTWPFCSEKCRDADLHGWLSEEYKFSRELTAEEMDEWLQKQHGALNPYDPDNF